MTVYDTDRKIMIDTEGAALFVYDNTWEEKDFCGAPVRNPRQYAGIMCRRSGREYLLTETEDRQHADTLFFELMRENAAGKRLVEIEHGEITRVWD